MYNEAKIPEFKQVQYAFAKHLRNPAKNPQPDNIEARRMKIYSELFYNNVEGFMSNAYPVLRELTVDEKWHRMIRDYFEKHNASTPYFQEMPREFLKYLENEREAEQDDYPFMLELAHYEWVELALSVTDIENDYTNVDVEGDLLEGVPVLSKTAWPLNYNYPVHEISTECLPEQPGEQPTYLVVYRNSDDDVHFLDINPVTAQLLQYISEDSNLTCKQMLTSIAEQLNHPNPDVVIQGGLQILDDLKTRGVIIGVNKS
ncbi:FIG005107: hypothetical protein [hydrothermal vent metagenome]|uniref:Uncharacterized protein n=1 Tax=hydrothermal vent metagenome TaxID=652676 RepID=A0A3B1A6X4_9ZZZZ